jgi:hypothetical protein
VLELLELMLVLLMVLMLLLLLLLLLHPILQFSGPHGRAAMVERREPLGLAIHGSGLACLASLGGGAGKRGVNAVRKGA